MTTEEIAARLDAKKSGTGWMAKCPAHEDSNASLSINEGDDGKTLLNCHAGCSFTEIVAKAGLKAADCFLDKPRRTTTTKRNIVATYPYTDANGTLLFESVRYEPKDFSQRQPDGNGHYIWSLKAGEFVQGRGGDWCKVNKHTPANAPRRQFAGVQTVLFRLPEILLGVKNELPIVIVEGEKDALTLVANGFEATCNPLGAGKWRDKFSETLASANCVIIPDNDRSGLKHAAEVAASLHGKAASIRVVTLPEVLDGQRVKDASDYFNAGATAADFQAICSEALEWEPDTGVALDSGCLTETQPIAVLTACLRGAIVEALTSRDEHWKQRQSIATHVVDALAKLGRFYFHAEQRDFKSALYFNAQSKQLEWIGSDAFVAWLSKLCGVNRNEWVFRNIVTEVQNAALTGPHTTGILPAAYWASQSGAIYLSNGDGQLVKVSAEAVTLADNGTDGVLFPVGSTLKPWRLVEPQDPFKSCSLFSKINTTALHGKLLLQLWTYSMTSNHRSKPPLVTIGPIGSGKTRTIQGIAELYGMPFLACKVLDMGEDDFWTGIDAGGLFTLDNADTNCRWIADSVAAASTGACSPRRKKYTDKDQIVLKPRSWLGITSAEPHFASDPGLADRLIVVRMGRRKGETLDNALTDEILGVRDAGLSHMVKVLQAALADKTPTPRGLNARHPDFAEFAVRIGRALGLEAESVKALRVAEADKSQVCVENDPLASVLLEYLETSKHFIGPAAELLPHLQNQDPSLRSLTPKGLGKRLSSLMPHLEVIMAVAKSEPKRGTSVFEFAICKTEHVVAAS